MSFRIWAIELIMLGILSRFVLVAVDLMEEVEKYKQGIDHKILDLWKQFFVFGVSLLPALTCSDLQY